jgi:DUF4097 and DUF4098 domain-containing protein YvlB
MKRILVLLFIISLLAAFPVRGNEPKPPKPPKPAEHPQPAIAPSQHEEGAGQTMTFNVNPGEDLEVDTSGDIEVKTWDKNEVLVNAMDSDEESRLSSTRVGKIVRVNSHGEYADISITVPSRFNIDVVTSSGEIQFKGAITGMINASTGGGDIDMDNATGEVDLKTSGGTINIKDMDGNAQLHSSGGEIYVGRVTGNLDIFSGGGDLSLNDVGKNLDAKTGGGNIDAGNVGGTATLSTGGGDVSIGTVKGKLNAGTGGGSISAGKVESSVTAKTSGGDIELGGATGAVIARSSGGSITVDDMVGTLDASTSGGDVMAKLRPTGIGPNSIASAGGDITLYIPETAKVTIDAVIRIRGRWTTRSEESEIQSDFKATSYVKDEDQSEVRGKYAINGGGEQIILETVNSNITIRILK